MLGPLLFTMFVNEMLLIVSSPVLTIRKHFVSLEMGMAALQNDLDTLYRWSQQWQLKFDISKCKHLHFGPPYHKGPYYLNEIFITGRHCYITHQPWYSF